jgi:multidrug transporter EmrE-like cation transporter
VGAVTKSEKREAYIAVIIGILVYREKASPYQFIGLGLGITAIVFLSMG